MSTSAQERLNEQYADLMARAKSMRASGYHASADHLMQRAWRCAMRREEMATQEIVCHAVARPANDHSQKTARSAG